jgi:hypothetical protein
MPHNGGRLSKPAATDLITTGIPPLAHKSLHVFQGLPGHFVGLNTPAVEPDLYRG